MRISALAVSIATPLAFAVYGCRPSAPKVAVVPLSPKEEYCWWAVYRTSLPLDTVVNRFAAAFTSIGFAPPAPSQVGDTAWVNVGPSKLTGYEGRPIEARIVAYRAGDSTHFRTFVAGGRIADNLHLPENFRSGARRRCCAARARWRGETQRLEASPLTLRELGSRCISVAAQLFAMCRAN